MKKIIATLLALSMICSLSACTSGESSNESEKEAESSSVVDSSSEESKEEETLPVATASSIIEYLKDNTDNIGNFIEYDENTDTNGLLGRPNQYTSKINFEITTIEQIDENDPLGGMIEVFNTHEDAVARQEYIQEIGKEMSVLSEYDYVNDYVLLRIHHNITPTEEKKYEEALDAYMDSMK